MVEVIRGAGRDLKLLVVPQRHHRSRVDIRVVADVFPVADTGRKAAAGIGRAEDRVPTSIGSAHTVLLAARTHLTRTATTSRPSILGLDICELHYLRVRWLKHF